MHSFSYNVELNPESLQKYSAIYIITKYFLRPNFAGHRTKMVPSTDFCGAILQWEGPGSRARQVQVSSELLVCSSPNWGWNCSSATYWLCGLRQVP